MALLGYLGVVISIFILSNITICFITGNERRSYQVLARSDELTVGGNAIALEQLARTFQPKLAQRAGDYSPRALTMWWEAIDAGDDIVLVYHPVWQDERHPVPLLHWIYYIYRAIVYGMPVRDIEYIQININRGDGSIQKIRYEGSTATSYDQPLTEHIHVIIERSVIGYREMARMQNNTFRIRNIQIAGPVLTFGVATWSHQLILLENGAGTYTIPISMPLEHLTEENYTKHKLARRSQGDFVTQEGAVGRSAKMVVKIIFMGLPFLISKVRHERS